MTNKQKTFLNVFLPILTLFCGVIGTAFAMGANNQYITDTLVGHASAIDELETSMDLQTTRYIEIITSISELRTDIQVLIKTVETLD